MTNYLVPFQVRVYDWVIRCFGGEASVDVRESAHRFVEVAE